MKNLEKKRKKYNSQERGTINFFGGEPTLLWNEIIVPVTNYIKENNFPIDIGMTTNGTLLNKERIDFLKDNNIQLLLSMDGDKETQDFNRPCANGESSFDKINKIIPDLLEAFPNITFRSTIYAPTVENTFKNYLFAIEKGFKNIFLMPDARHFWSEEEKEKLLQEIDKIFIYNEICFSKNILPINFSTINNMMKELILFFSDKKIELEISRNIYRCGLGTINGSIGFDGSIYGCQE